jgi:hypothetical protein
LDFGTLNVGESVTRTVRITNNGNSSLYLEAIVGGDSFFRDNTYINETLWENYSDNYGAAQAKDVNVKLTIPTSFSGSGIRQGSLTFWAASQ